MNSSCSNALLEAVLAGDLPPDDESALARHLEECEACSSALERLAGGPAWCREAASLLADNPDLVDALVTHRFGLDDAAEAFRVAADRKAGAIKIVIEP